MRSRMNDAAALKTQEEDLARELADVNGRLGGGKRLLPLLDTVRVASPCSANWEEMVGNAHVRYCLHCEKNVYNLSEMKRDEAEALLQEHLGGSLCVRFYQRADGTILTQDCPVGVSKKRRKKLALAVAGAGAMAMAAASYLKEPRSSVQGEAMPVEGAIVVTGDVPVPPNVNVDPTPEPPPAPKPSPTVPVRPKHVGQWTAGAIAPPRPPPVKMMGKIAMPDASKPSSKASK